MPQSEKLKLKAEMVTGDREVDDPRVADQKTLARQIYEAYLKNFNMNKAKARSILSGKTSSPVRELRVTGWSVNGYKNETSEEIKGVFCNFLKWYSK